MRNLILLLIVIIVGSSCATEKRCSRKFPPIIKDSTYVKETIEYRDRVVYDTIKGDTIETVIKITDLDTVPIIIENDFAVGLLSRENNVLRLKLVSKDTVIARMLKDAEILRSSLVERHTVEVHTVKYIPKFYKFTMWWFIGCLVVVIIYIVMKIIKFNIMPFKFLR